MSRMCCRLRPAGWCASSSSSRTQTAWRAWRQRVWQNNARWWGHHVWHARRLQVGRRRQRCGKLLAGAERALHGVQWRGCSRSHCCLGRDCARARHGCSQLGAHGRLQVGCLRLWEAWRRHVAHRRALRRNHHGLEGLHGSRSHVGRPWTGQHEPWWSRGTRRAVQGIAREACQAERRRWAEAVGLRHLR